MTRMILGKRVSVGIKSFIKENKVRARVRVRVRIRNLDISFFFNYKRCDIIYNAMERDNLNVFGYLRRIIYNP